MPPRKPRLKSTLTSWWNIIGHVRDRSLTPSGRIQLGIYVALILTVLGFAGLYDALIWSAPEPVTPDEFKMGWNESLAKAEAPRIAAMMPKFEIVDANGDPVSGAGKNAELWKYEKLANGGKHIPCFRQETGDCVANGAARVIACRQAIQIARESRNEVLKIPDRMYIYGISRVQIGKRRLGRGAGSLGAWAAQGSQSHGVLTVEAAEAMGYVYSGRLADQWGWNGPPENAIVEARKFRIRTVSQINNALDCRDALVNGYPVTVASNVGFTGGSYDRDGKRWLRARGQWAHQMAILGVEDRPGRQKGFWIQNSWGENAHPKPLNDEPPGGFWAEWNTVDSMLRQGDSWAFSDFDGFPSTEIDWQTFKDDVAESVDTSDVEQAAVVAADVPEPEPATLKETRRMLALPVSVTLLLLGSAIGFGCLFYRSRLNTRGGRIAMTLLLSFGLIGAGFTVEAGPRNQRRAARFGYSAGSNSSGGGIARCVAPTVRPKPIAPATPQIMIAVAKPNCVCGVDCQCPQGNCKCEPIAQSDWQTIQADADMLVTATAQVDSTKIEANDVMPVGWNAFAAHGNDNQFLEPIGTWNTMPAWSEEELDLLSANESGKPVLLMYTAKWCLPCQSAHQALKANASNLPFTIREIDIDDDPSYRGDIPHFAYETKHSSTGWAFLGKEPGWHGVEDLKTKWGQRVR